MPNEQTYATETNIPTTDWFPSSITPTQSGIYELRNWAFDTVERALWVSGQYKPCAEDDGPHRTCIAL